ncbi:alpha/beta hydrolase [Pseudonocardia sp. MCCB 268]|nr:alpha/beta hydrolase [Pseudonocardia cytotoxica]
MPRPDVDEQWVDVDAGERGTVRTCIIRPAGSNEGPSRSCSTSTVPAGLRRRPHPRPALPGATVGAGAAGVFPVYDNAPEAKYPTQIEQNYAVGRWLRKSTAPSTASTPLRRRGRRIGRRPHVRGVRPHEQRALRHRSEGAAAALPSPTRTSTPRPTSSSPRATTTCEGMQWFWNHYATPEQRTEHHAAPLRSTLDQLAGLPPALVITDEADVLRDEGEKYANRLREAGVDVTSIRVAGMVHDFLLLDSLRDTKGPRRWRESSRWTSPRRTRPALTSGFRRSCERPNALHPRPLLSRRCRASSTDPW